MLKMLTTQAIPILERLQELALFVASLPESTVVSAISIGAICFGAK